MMDWPSSARLRRFDVAATPIRLLQENDDAQRFSGATGFLAQQIDELAHTNSSTMHHAKRYEDIEDILDAGIDVISTVNIQHLESLNDAIFELTGVRVRETFPDRILDEADEVVLVDLSPEELRERLRAGKVYPRERAEVALENFFRQENLAALRELVLREVAEDVEARRNPATLEPLSRQAVAERILALIEPQPKSQRILRRAWRSSQRLGAEIDALWMRPDGREPTEEEATQLAALRRLASLLGIQIPRADSVQACRNRKVGLTQKFRDCRLFG